MRLRYKLVTYHFGEDQQNQQSVQRHYRELMDELLRQGQHPALTHQAVQWRPPTDIHETPEAILVNMELAGMREDDIEITLYEDALVVSGRRDNSAVPEHVVYYHEVQIRYGPFRAEILLPVAVERDGVVAKYENGFLSVALPKSVNRQREETRIAIRRDEQPIVDASALQAASAMSWSDLADQSARADDADEERLMGQRPPEPPANETHSIHSTRGGLGDA